MTSKRLCLVEILVFLAVLAASQAVAQSNQQQTHPQHTSGERMPSGAPLPPLKILMPENGATVGTQLALVFQTPADLSKMMMGAAALDTHLHIEAQDVSVMPSREQLVRLGEDRYLFLFDLPAKPGKNMLRIYWSDGQHEPIASTVQQITLTVEPDGAQ